VGSLPASPRPATRSVYYLNASTLILQNGNGTNDAGKPVVIDLEGIEKRVVPFPLPEGKYKQVRGMKRKVLLLSQPLEMALHEDAEEEGTGQLGHFDFETLKYEGVADGVNAFTISRDGKQVMYQDKWKSMGKKPWRARTMRSGQGRLCLRLVHGCCMTERGACILMC
jgi:tricorn protease-like protein